MTIQLSPDELLSTTRSVRRRLDLARPVDLSIIRECLSLAIQAPSGSNQQGWHFVVVTDPEKKRALADIYRRAWAIYAGAKMADLAGKSAELTGEERVFRSADYLASHMHEVPVLLIPCIQGRCENESSASMAGTYGSILPAAWSFMLAARSRGLASCWTTLHLIFEEEAAQILGIPYAAITQNALLPVAYALGTDFKPAARKPLDDILHVDRW